MCRQFNRLLIANVNFPVNHLLRPAAIPPDIPDRWRPLRLTRPHHHLHRSRITRVLYDIVLPTVSATMVNLVSIFLNCVLGMRSVNSCALGCTLTLNHLQTTTSRSLRNIVMTLPVPVAVCANAPTTFMEAFTAPCEHGDKSDSVTVCVRHGGKCTQGEKFAHLKVR